MTFVFRAGWMLSASAAAMLWLAGCAGPAEDKQAEDNSVLRGRANFSDLRSLNKMLERPPVHERQNGPIAVVYKSSGELDFLKSLPRSFWFPNVDIADLEEVSDDGLIPEDFGEHLFLRMINDAGFAEARGYSRTHAALADHFSFDSGSALTYRYDRDEALPLVKDLGRLGNAWILLVNELDISGYAIGRPTLHGAKGTIRKDDDVVTYASFQVGLIDTEFGKLKAFDFHIQVTLEYLEPMAWQDGFAGLGAEDQARVVDAIMARMQENVRQTLLLYKIIPIRGDEFMTLDDLEKHEIIDLSYPE